MTRPAHRRGSRALRTLAGRMGILPDFVDVLGRRRRTSDATREALLAAMGCPAASDAEARAILERLDDSERERVLAPVQVVRGNIPATLALSAQPGATSYELEVTEETGTVHRSGGALGGRGARVPFPSTLRAGLPPGYHRVRVRLGGDHAWHAEQLLIVAPLRCSPPRGGEKRRNRRFGLTVNLWTVSSARNWGAGDFTDLAELAEWAGAHGAAFIGVNPLYALRCRRGEESPYNPLTRLFRNPLYLDVIAVPEFAESAEARQLVVSPAFRTALGRVRGAATVDHVAVMTLKRDVLRALFQTFCSRHAGRETPRDLAYRRYLAERGSLLDDFATFLALEEHFGMSAWPAWPDAFHDPRGPAARAFRAERTEAVDFHRWVQFELDRQLAAAAGRAAAAGVANGFVGDLPVGTAPASNDAWAFPGLFARGVHIGAPPDEYAPEGQDWGLAPLDPHRLRAERHAYWILVVRAALAHQGALRVDHVMGLLRQYWIPAGRPAAEGAYVRYPADDLFGILALESTRRDAAVIGEDLGTVAPEIPRLLRRWGVLSTRVMYFARDRRGRFLPARRYSPRALVMAGTHDQPPLAGYWSGRDLTLRRAVGVIASDRALAKEQAERERARRALRARLRLDSPADLARAVYAFLARTPAPLLGVALDDLARTEEPLHLPGVAPSRFRGWVRRVPLSLETLRRDAGALGVLRAVAAVRGGARP